MEVAPKITKTSIKKLKKIIALLSEWQCQYPFTTSGLPMGNGRISLTMDAFNASVKLGNLLEKLEEEAKCTPFKP